MCWKNRPKKRSNAGANRPEFPVALFVLLLMLGTAAPGADKVTELQDRFDKESHATSKVKILDKLADAQFEAATKAGDAGDFITVGLTMEKYRDNVRTAFQLLKKQEPDAEHHHTGYRQLELQVRKGLREVEEILLIVPLELRPPMEIVHKDLLDMDDELIRLLFPRRTPNPQNVPPVPTEKP